mgnify:CR=1 FL=1
MVLLTTIQIAVLVGQIFSFWSQTEDIMSHYWYKPRLLLLFLSMICLPSLVQAESKYITVASTTSTESSGLFSWILPKFTARTGIEVRVVAVGTGAAIRHAKKGDADVLLVHHLPSEKKFVEDGFGVHRFPLMWNDFVLVGPEADPAGARGMKDITKALVAIHSSKALFVSRGDDSGTHKKSLEIWKQAAIDVKKFSGKWYREAGSGMGATLNIAVSMNGYTLTDRSTWQAFKNKGALKLLFEGDPGLRNQYGIILVNPERHKHIKMGLASTFIDWVLSEPGQAAINRYRLAGRQTFFANARGTGKLN